MKLLSPQIIKDTKAQEVAIGILRTKELNEAASVARRNLADAEADFKTTLARNRVIWAREEDDHSIRVEEMNKEIEVLDNKKSSALVPIEIYKKQAEDLMNEAKNALEMVKTREDEVEDLNQRLQDKLDATGAKEQDLGKLEQQLILKQQGIELQQDQTKTGIKKLSEQIAEFTLAKQQAEKDIDERKTALVLWDRTLQAEAEKQKRTYKEMEDWSIRLKLERNLLDKNWKLLKHIPLEK